MRKLFGLNTNITVRTVFQKKDKGGLDIRKPSLIYTAVRIGFLVNMLNHSNENIRFVARNSLELHMKKRGVVRSRTENNFLGYAVKENGLLLDTNLKGGFGVKSDWPHLNHLTQKVDAKILWEFPEQPDLIMSTGNAQVILTVDTTTKVIIGKAIRKEVLESQLIADSNKLKSLPMQRRLYDAEELTSDTEIYVNKLFSTTFPEFKEDQYPTIRKLESSSKQEIIY